MVRCPSIYAIPLLTHPHYSSNMLYPKENKADNTLMFACRTCQFSEQATSSCVFRNELTNTVADTAGITQDVGSDPTVGTSNIVSTAHRGSVDSGYEGGERDQEVDAIPSFCTMCGQVIVCEICGEDYEGDLCLEVVDQDVQMQDVAGQEETKA